MVLDGLSGQSYQHAGGLPTVMDVGNVVSPPKPGQNKSATETWALSVGNLAVHQGLAHKIDKLSAASGSTSASPPPRSYAHWLGLGTEQIKASELSWNRLGQTVSGNLSGKGVPAASTGFSAKTFAKETLVDRNFKPVKNLVTGQSAGNRGQGLLNTTGLGLVGLDVFRHSRDAYKDAKAQGDGALGAAAATATATGKYTLRSAVSWEAAGLGFSLGKALAPISIKGIPVGGVLAGALTGMLGQKTADKVLKTGDQDPVQQRKAIAEALKENRKTAPSEALPVPD
ncbi:hypothetical protein [Vampirovibrio chlorellavorus]|uniref:hypothetical protein n=1 Tax=Vampirovibrio chlorellavorus TaxID=758823 RepID=UPI0026E96DE6|nr:hypothetical protein [Vampirovibrio chlorellavorus]